MTSRVMHVNTRPTRKFTTHFPMSLRWHLTRGLVSFGIQPEDCVFPSTRVLKYECRAKWSYRSCGYSKLVFPLIFPFLFSFFRPSTSLFLSFLSLPFPIIPLQIQLRGLDSRGELFKLLAGWAKSGAEYRPQKHLRPENFMIAIIFVHFAQLWLTLSNRHIINKYWLPLPRDGHET